jgi:excisionase family DNA binding protein
MMKQASEKLLTVFEAEALTGRKASTWRRDILRRKIPYVKIGRQVRIPIETINDLIRNGYRAPIQADRS